MSDPLHAAAEHAEGPGVWMQRGGQRRDGGRAHGGQPGAVHDSDGDAGDDIVHDLQAGGLRQAVVLGVAGIALDPLAAAGQIAGNIGGHGVEKDILIGMDADLGGHLVFVPAVGDHRALDQFQRLFHVRTGLDALILGQPQNLAAKIELCFQILVLLVERLQQLCIGSIHVYDLLKSSVFGFGRQLLKKDSSNVNIDIFHKMLLHFLSNTAAP